MAQDAAKLLVWLDNLSAAMADFMSTSTGIVISYYTVSTISMATLFDNTILDAFEAGYQFLGGGRLGYPKTPEHLERDGYKKFTTVLVLLCHINQQVKFCNLF